MSRRCSTGGVGEQDGRSDRASRSRDAPTSWGRASRCAACCPTARRRMVGPFIFLDHAGPRVTLKRAHSALARRAAAPPHRPLDGQLRLRRRRLDAPRQHQPPQIAIRPGEVNWMTAGRGVSHCERTRTNSRTGLRARLQAWVALPRVEETAPAFHHPTGGLPELRRAGRARLIVGTYGADRAGQASSPIFYLQWRWRRAPRRSCRPNTPSGGPTWPRPVAIGDGCYGRRTCRAGCRPAGRGDGPARGAKVMLSGGASWSARATSGGTSSPRPRSP